MIEQGAPLGGRGALLVAGLLLLSLSCGGDDPKGPMSPEPMSSEPTTPGPTALRPADFCSDHPKDAVATFEDATLAGAVADQLGRLSVNELTCGLLSRWDGPLNFSAQRIVSVVGIQNLPGVTGLDLAFNSIADISVLRNLANLEWVELTLNRDVTDISPLNNLTSLEWVDLSFTSITDVTLSGLTNLRHLQLRNNLITDIELSEFTSLSWLDLRNNRITDISTLSGLTSLTDLLLENNSITDISPLSGLTGLTFLNLENGLITDISALSGLTSLRVLDLGDNSVTDISVLSGLTSLVLLDLSNNPDLINIQPLLDNSGLKAGIFIDLRATKVSCADVEALKAKVDYVVHNDCD